MWLPATSTDLPRTAHRVGPTLCRIKSELLELLHSAAVYRVSMKILSQIMGCCQDWSWSELIRLINWNQASRCQEGLNWTWHARVTFYIIQLHRVSIKGKPKVNSWSSICAYLTLIYWEFRLRLVNFPRYWGCTDEEATNTSILQNDK